mgnify:CR=1 FL=1|tara:strand:- start:111 stop:518 length:408 start_codon:yes stop_codon:yes gene_type:complete
MWKIVHFLKFSFSAAFTGIFCCIAPVILFQFGLISGIYAISFADFFYKEDGSVGIGAIILRLFAFIIIILGIIKFNQKENCSLNSPKEKKINKIIFAIISTIIAIAIFWTLDEFSSYYFDEYIVPQQQLEYNTSS